VHFEEELDAKKGKKGGVVRRKNFSYFGAIRLLLLGEKEKNVQIRWEELVDLASKRGTRSRRSGREKSLGSFLGREKGAWEKGGKHPSPTERGSL